VLLIILSFLAMGCKNGFDAYYDRENSKGGFLYTRIKSDERFSLFA
jgi:hypothetical protein